MVEVRAAKVGLNRVAFEKNDPFHADAIL